MGVLVTGATGFTGSRLAMELRRRGEVVRALARPGAATGELEAAGVEVVRGELTNGADVMSAVRGTRVVYHIAAAYRSAKHPDSYYERVNVGGTEHVVGAARATGVERVVHCSTIGVHGGLKSTPGNEDSPFNPGDVYQRSKLEGERVARRAFEGGVPGVVVRPAGIYGPGDTRFLKLFRSVRNGTFCMFGDGRVMCHMVYIDDLVEGIIRCGTCSNGVGGTFVLAGPRAVTLNELVREVARAVGVSPPRLRLPLWPLLTAAAVCEGVCRPLGIEPALHRRRADFFRKDRAFSSARAAELIGYSPRVDLAEGLERAAEWYRSRGLLRARREPRGDGGEGAPGAAPARSA